MARSFPTLKKYQRAFALLRRATDHFRQYSRLRVLHVNLARGFGGRELRILNEMLAMRERGHHIEVGCAEGSQLGRQAQDHGFTTHYVGTSGLLASAFIPLQVRGIIRAGDFDVVNTHSVADDLQAALFARWARTCLLVRTHHPEGRHRVPPNDKTLSGHVITASDYQRQRYLESGYIEHRVRTIHTGLDVQDNIQEAPSTREKLGIPDDAIVVGNIADDMDAGGLRFLLEAISPLMEVHSEIHLVVSGLKEPRLTQLRKRALERGVMGKIHFIGQSLCIQQFLAAIDIYAMVPECEVTGSRFVEATARGVPVVATAIGCIPEVIENGVSGYVVLACDRLILRSVIGKLFEDSNLRIRFGEAGRAKFQVGRFSTAGMAEAVEGTYLEWMKE